MSSDLVRLHVWPRLLRDSSLPGTILRAAAFFKSNFEALI